MVMRRPNAKVKHGFRSNIDEDMVLLGDVSSENERRGEDGLISEQTSRGVYTR